MITLDLDHFDAATEIGIVQGKSGLPRKDAESVVRVVRGLRESGACEFPPTIRGAIMIAKLLRTLNGHARPLDRNATFLQICQDILASETSRVGSRTNQTKVRELVKRSVRQLR